MTPMQPPLSVAMHRGTFSASTRPIISEGIHCLFFAQGIQKVSYGDMASDRYDDSTV